MKIQINWTFWIRASTPAKLEKLLSTLDFGWNSITFTQHDKYWKDRSLFRSLAISEIEVSDAKEATGAVLSICQYIAKNWLIHAPIMSDTGDWEFGGSIGPESEKISWIESATFKAQANVRPAIPNLGTQASA